MLECRENGNDGVNSYKQNGFGYAVMNARDAWSATLGQLRVQLNRSTYDTWLRHAELFSHEDGRFIVSVPDAYVKDWIERHLLTAMAQTLSHIFRRAVQIQIMVWNPVEAADDAGGLMFDVAPLPQPSAPPPPLSTLTAVPTVPVVREQRGEGIQVNLNPAYTFDAYIIGDANRYAALLGHAIVESAIGKYSPVLFYGGMGMGKTHLLQSIARALLAKGLNVVYLTAEEFTAELVAAIRTHDMTGFRVRFRNADAVLIDDLQFIDGKDSTQSELVAIWDALRNRQRAMIMASNCLPRDMGKLSADARSRFQAGPIAALEMPDYNLRCAMLDAKLRARGIILADELRHWLAERITGSARELESAVEGIHTFHFLTGQPLSEATLRAALPALAAAGSPSLAAASEYTEDQGRLTVERILQVTAQHFRLSIDDVIGRGRSKVVVQARQIGMYLTRELTGAALAQIGAAFGGRDHSTILHGCNKIAQQVASGEALDADVRAIRDVLQRTHPTPARKPASAAPDPAPKSFDPNRILMLANAVTAKPK